MGKFIDLTGSKYGLLTVTSRAENYEKFSKTHDRVLKYARWNCICECGKESLEVLATDLKSGSQISCGCVRSEKAAERVTTHGMSESKEYAAWLNMKTRCTNENSEKWPEYGARGICVQPEWMDDFPRFFNHIGPAPSVLHSVDRIDTNGNYEEGNVKWSTPTEQAENQRKPKYGTNKYKWVSFCKKLCKYKGAFKFQGTSHTVGYFTDEKEAAINTYRFYKSLTGDWPKYCDEALIELGLV